MNSEWLFNLNHFIKDTVAIKTSTFGRVELSGQEAARFIRHMHEDKPNPMAQASLVRGRELLRNILAPTPARLAK